MLPDTKKQRQSASAMKICVLKCLLKVSALICECIIKLIAFFLLLVFVYLCVYHQMPKPKDNLRVFFPLTGGRLRSGNGGGKHV